MGTINPSIPTIGDLNATEDTDIRSALITIRDAINGGLDNDNIANAANIVYSKLNLANSILNADIASTAAIVPSKFSAIAARATRTSALSIPTTTETIVTLPTEDFDTSSFHDLTTNTNRLTIPTTGKYFINASVEFAGNTAGVRFAHLYIDGTTKVSSSTAADGSSLLRNLSVSTIYQLTAAQYVDLRVWQDSGIGGLNLNSANLNIFYIGT